MLLERPDFIVLNKPSGMAVHGGSGIRLGLIEAIRQVQPEWERAELAHRLDRETSGCLLIAKNAAFLKCAQDQFREHLVTKEYLALVYGHWPASISRIDARLQKDPVGDGERIVRVREEGKPALTRFEVEARFEDATLMRAKPETGRTHQIRVHCQFAGHPILGDDKYTPSASAAGPLTPKSLCLHAERLAFTEPGSEERIQVTAALDPQFHALLDALEKQ